MNRISLHITYSVCKYIIYIHIYSFPIRDSCFFRIMIVTMTQDRGIYSMKHEKPTKLFSVAQLVDPFSNSHLWTKISQVRMYLLTPVRGRGPERWRPTQNWRLAGISHRNGGEKSTNDTLVLWGWVVRTLKGSPKMKGMNHT